MAPLEVMGEFRGPGEERTATGLAAELPAGWYVIAGRKLSGESRDDLDRGCIRYAVTELDVRGFESLPVTVVGGANSAGQAALSLAGRGSRVTLVLRSADLGARMSAYLASRILAHPRIEA